MHHLLQEADYPHLHLGVELKVLRTNTGTTSRVITEVCFFQLQIHKRHIETHKNSHRGKGALYLRVFGDPVTQNIQDSVRGSSSDNKLFVPIPLVGWKTWNTVNIYSPREIKHYNYNSKYRRIASTFIFIYFFVFPKILPLK